MSEVTLETITTQNDIIIGLLTEIRDAIVDGPSVPITKDDREELERAFDRSPKPVRVQGYTEPVNKFGKYNDHHGLIDESL